VIQGSTTQHCGWSPNCDQFDPVSQLHNSQWSSYRAGPPVLSLLVRSPGDKMLNIKAEKVDGSAYFYWSYTDGITHADACRTSAKPWIPYKSSYVCENANYIDPSRLLYLLFTPETIIVGLWTDPSGSQALTTMNCGGVQTTPFWPRCQIPPR
jgi:hypothetical protein